MSVCGVRACIHVLSTLSALYVRVFWQGDGCKNIALQSGTSLLCQSKDQEQGLGIHDLNITLFSKWLFKFLAEDDFFFFWVQSYEAGAGVYSL
jgi:hypothetical protein